MLSLLGSLRRGNFVQRSLRFRSSASADLSRTFSTPTNNKIYTFSAWVKRGSFARQGLFIATNAGATTYSSIQFLANDVLDVQGSNGTWKVETSQVFRDTSAWYHIVVAIDTPQLTASNRVKVYVNGSQVTSFSTATYPTVDSNNYANSAVLHRIASWQPASSSLYFDGYLTEVNFIDGQALTPSSFGQIESTTGVWSPKQYAGSYGTNGFYLKFGNTSSVAALGTDSSGNGNTWTVNNVSLTAGATYDSMIDVPVNYSDSGNGRGNYAVLNPLINTGGVTANANLQVTTTVGVGHSRATIAIPATGKWYAEFTAVAAATSTDYILGIVGADTAEASFGYNQAPSYSYSAFGERIVNGTFTSSFYSSYTTGDIIGCAVDLDANQLTWYKNGVAQTAISIANGSYFWMVSDASGARQVTAAFNAGQRPFAYTPPAGFRALNTNNLPTPSIVNGANFMAATTYTGNGAARSLSNAVNNVSFQPDLVWIKSRTPGATSHALFDSSRGVTKYLSSNTTTAETTLAQSLTALNADGFSLGTDTTLVNATANSYVAWQWRESITAGLDIVTYTGTGVTRTVAHNLGVAPAMIIIKDRGAAVNWVAYHSTQGAGKFLRLNTTDAATADLTIWNNTAPTSFVFTVGGVAGVNTNTNTYVAYCFAEIAGFSKFGSYTGNGSADGPFVFCGFRPRFVMVKAAVGGVGNWVMHDSTRSPSNAVGLQELSANSPGTEPAGIERFDFTANGFKVRSVTAQDYNISGVTYIFMAFAEVPSKYALAR
jgi:hypothetical protein